MYVLVLAAAVVFDSIVRSNSCEPRPSLTPPRACTVRPPRANPPDALIAAGMLGRIVLRQDWTRDAVAFQVTLLRLAERKKSIISQQAKGRHVTSCGNCGVVPAIPSRPAARLTCLFWRDAGYKGMTSRFSGSFQHRHIAGRDPFDSSGETRHPLCVQTPSSHAAKACHADSAI